MACLIGEGNQKRGRERREEWRMSLKPKMMVTVPMIQRKERRKPTHREKGEESRSEEGKQSQQMALLTAFKHYK